MIYKSDQTERKMKQKHSTLSRFQSMIQSVLASLKGGDEEKIMYIECYTYNFGEWL